MSENLHSLHGSDGRFAPASEEGSPETLNVTPRRPLEVSAGDIEDAMEHAERQIAEGADVHFQVLRAYSKGLDHVAQVRERLDQWMSERLGSIE